MQLGWKSMLPLALGFFVLISSILVGFALLATNNIIFFIN